MKTILLHNNIINNKYKATLTGFFNRTLFLLMTVLCLQVKATGQQLELSSSSLSASNVGPVTTVPAANFLSNTGTSGSFNTYSPATTVTFSFTNQQYTSASIPGLIFGAAQTIGGPGSAITVMPDLVPMNSIGSPQSSDYTSGPFGTAGTDIDVSANYAANISVNAYYQQQPTIAPYTSRPYYGDLVISFNRPVINPVVHFVGMGFTYYNLGQFQHGAYTEYELTSAETAAGYSFTRLSGSTYFGVTSSTVVNTNTTVNTDLNNFMYYASQAMTAAGGSIRVNTGSTSVTQITLKVFLRGMPSFGSSALEGWFPQDSHGGDNTLVSVSVDLNDISGTVFNDFNGLTDNIVNGGSPSAAGNLFVNLVDVNGNIFASTAVDPVTGAYSFTDVVAAAGYKLVLSTVNGSTSTSLPANYANTGENIGAGSGSDGTPDGIIQLGSLVGSGNVTNANFGIRSCASSPAVVVSASASPLIYCAGSATPVTLTSSASGGGGTFTYLWAGSGVANTTAQNTTATPAVSGTYTLTATDQFNCKASATTGNVIYSNPVPAITTQCINSTSFRLIESNGSTWLWTTTSQGRFYPDATYSVATDSSTSHLQAPYIKATGGYTVQITDQYGCVGTGSITVISGNCATVLAADKLLLAASTIVSGKVTLTWQTMPGKYVAYSIERQQEGLQFDNIADVAGSQNTYTTSVSNIAANKLFYRIKAVTPDGGISYSNIVVIKNIAGSAAMVYPNPVIKGGQVIIKYTGLGMVQVAVTNINGVEVINKSIDAGSFATLQNTVLNTGGLSSGMYLVRITSKNQEVKTCKLLVQ